MSVGPASGVPGSAAGVPLSQAKGSEVDRAAQDSSGQQRRTESNQRADRASGIGETERDEGSSERDADGRRLWEKTDHDAPDSEEHQSKEREKKSKDISGESGRSLDLMG